MLGGVGPSQPPCNSVVAKAIARTCRRDGNLPSERRRAIPQSSRGWHDLREVARVIGAMPPLKCSP
eukprot:4716736-Lingulodinium_polyedra.AAC.1